MKRLIILIVLCFALLSSCKYIDRVSNPLVGEWEATIWTLTEVVTFYSDNTVTFNNPIDGMRVYEYEVLEEDKIKLTNLDTGKTFTRDFKVLGDYKAIKIDDITYYRKD